MGWLRAEGLGKAYKRYPSEGARLVEWASLGMLRRHERSWVLRGVACSIGEGEAVAIVGRNGAGKSTLLRLLAGTLVPTEGRVERAGRLAVLELGMRFHPEMSGEENAIAGGQMLGVPASVIREHLPEIEEFSELGARLGDPLRTYSAGMHLRLAFSVASAVRPDVLLIDEALAVGDAAFQQKCVARIRGFMQAGTAVVLVSHDPVAVRRLCGRAILLEEGRVIEDGLPGATLDHYNALLARRGVSYEIAGVETEREHEAPAGTNRDGESAALPSARSEDEQPLPESALRQTRSGEGSATILQIEVGRVQDRDSNLQLPASALESKREFGVAEGVRVQVTGRAERAIEDLTVGIAIRDRFGSDVFGTNTHHLGAAGLRLEAGDSFRAEFDFPMNLGVGDYTVTAALHAGRTHLEGNYDWWDHALSFRVVPSSEPYSVGIAYLPTRSSLRSLHRSNERGGKQ